MSDLRYALRRLFKSPGFSAVVVVTLALGIGANSAIFSVVNAVLMRPLPYPQPDRLVALYHTVQGERAVVSGPNFIDTMTNARSFENGAAMNNTRVNLTGDGDPVRLDAEQVSASLFNVLRVRPALGRTFNADENTPGKTNVIILSYGLWQQRFGGAMDVIGRRVQIDGVTKEIVGVMPKGFSYPPGREAWLPIEYDQNFVSTQRGAWYLNVIARLKPGVTPQQANAEVQAVGRNLASKYEMDRKIGLAAVPLKEAIVGDIRRSLLVLLGAVALVLLIACVNVANLLLARAASRESEMAVRAALGARRGRLLRQLLSEALILAGAGAALGLLLAVWGVDFLVSLQPEGIPRLGSVHVDAAVVLFTAGMAAVTAILFGLVPALHSTRAALSSSLKEGGRGAIGGRGAGLRSLLVASEMAFAMMLLVGAGLLIRSFVKLQAVDPGFDPARTLTFELTLPDVRYSADEQKVAFFDRLMPSLQVLPGVRSVGAVMGLPLSGTQFDISFTIEGRPPVPMSEQPDMEIRVATPGYFSTLGIPLKRGRLFTEGDREGTPRVVLITEAAARRFFPHEDPLGKKIQLGWGRKVDGGRTLAGGEIVGIVGDVKNAGLSEPNAPHLYLPLRQWPVSSMAVALKCAVPPESLVEAAAARVHAVDPNMPVSKIRTLDEIVARSISQPRFYATLLGVFAALAMALAAIGIFGVLSYTVAQRTREIGVRIALGAHQDSVIGLVVRQAMTLVAAGWAAGIVAALLVSESLGKMLFLVKPHDPGTFVAVSLALGLIALLASYLPARRAARVDPVVALRTE
jgi:putative ABC transport system permease protein